MKGIKLFILSGLYLLLFSTWLNPTLQQSDKGQKDLQHEVTVTLKLIQIFVTDKDGNPVTDLDISDFELYDNGKLKALTEFEKHTLALPTEVPRAEKLKEKVSQREEPPKINRKFLLFFDFAFNEFAGIPKSRRAALHFIDTQLHPEDEVGVITYDTFRGLTLREYFTADHEIIREIIGGFGAKDVQGRAENIFRDFWEEKRGLDWMEEKKQKIAKNKEENYMNQVQNFSEQLKDMARALRYVPGSKHIILFSGGIANNILYGTMTPETQTIGLRVKVKRTYRGNSGLREIYEKMSEELAAANCLVYPINTAGKSVSHFRTRDNMGDYSLRQMAKISGGDYYDSISSYEEITEKIQNITSSYYVLGYYIDEKWDGKYHKIKVKVKRKGCKVFGQRGYFNPKPFAAYNELERLMHLVDLALSEKPLLQEPLRFPLITLPFPSDKDRPNLLTITKIPFEKIKEISGGKMEVVTLIFDEKNNIVEMQKSKTSEAKLAGDVYYYSLSHVNPAVYECRVVIRNLDTGQGATASSSVTIPEASGAEFELFPPLLLLPTENAQYFKSSENLDEMSITDVYPFDMSKYAPVVGETNSKTSHLLACVPYFSASNESDFELNTSLIHLDANQEINVDSLLIDDNDTGKSAQHLLIKIKMLELLSGQYALLLSVEEKDTHLRSQTEAFFTIK